MPGYQWVAEEEVSSSKLNFTGIAHVTDTGVANAYTADPQVTDDSGTYDAFSAYYEGLAVTFVPANTNTDASTLNLNAIGGDDIIRRDGTAILPGDLLAGVPAFVIHDGTNWRLQNPNNNAIQDFIEAGVDISANRAVAIESDGLLYPPRIIDDIADPSYTVQSVTVASSSGLDNVGSKRIIALPPFVAADGDVKCAVLFVAFNGSSVNAEYILNRFNITDNAWEAGGINTTSFKGAANLNTSQCALTSDKAIFFTKTGGNVITARCYSGFQTTSGSGGSEVNVLGSNGISVVASRYDDDTALVVYAESDTLKAVKLEISGTTITVGTPTTLKGSDIGSAGVWQIERFGDTDYYLVAYQGDADRQIMIVQFDGATITPGTPVSVSEFGAGTHSFTIATLDNTKAVVTYMDNSSVEAAVVNRSGTTASLQTAVVLATSGLSNLPVIAMRWDDTTFEVGYPTSGSSGNYGQRSILGRVDGNTINAIGSAVEVLGSNTRNWLDFTKIPGFKARVMFYQDTDDDNFFTTWAWDNTLNETIGMIREAVDDGDNANVFFNGVVPGLSGLTPGLEYFVDMGGEIISRVEGGTISFGRAIASTKLLLN